MISRKINSQRLEDTQVGYILQKYSLDKYTPERAFKPSYTFSSIYIHFRGWEGSSQKQNSKINALCFFNFFYLIDRYWPEIGNPKVWLTNQLTNQLTWVGARDTCVSKKKIYGRHNISVRSSWNTFQHQLSSSNGTVKHKDKYKDKQKNIKC